MISRKLPSTQPAWLVPGVCLCLVVVTWLVFGQTLKHEFVNYDDLNYIQKRTEITNGLTLNGIEWAFAGKRGTRSDWNPLSYISHMVDYQLFGSSPGGHHFGNVVLHTTAVLLLFFLLRHITGKIWRSAFVAALFAIHPLRGEAVAWVADRDTILGGVFFMLTLMAYVRYAEKPSISRYATMSILFVLGLLSKSILVTLPLVLLFIDYWPLARFDSTAPSRSLTRLILEKIPLFLLSAAGCLVTLFTRGKGMSSLVALPISLRLSNGLISYVVYIWEMIWPAKLAAFYPHTYGRVQLWEVLLALALLAALSAAAFVLRKRHAYFVTGWLWYLTMLVPVIGIVQEGTQAHADRYTYLPQIGLYLVVTWAIVDLAASWRYRHQILSVAAASILIALTWCASIQASYWRDSESLWTHTLSVTTNNDVAHNNLGLVFAGRGQLDEAITQYREAIKTDAGAGRHTFDVAIAHNNLGFALLQKQQFDAGMAEFEKAVGLFPNYTDARFNLANAFLEKGRIDDAIGQFQETLAIDPDDVEARTSLAHALVQKGKVRDALQHYEKALKIAPHSVWVLNDLAWIFATSRDPALRNGARAVELAQRTDQFSEGKNPIILRTLAAAYAERGDFTHAIETANQAREFAIVAKDPALTHSLEMDVDSYFISQPLRKDAPDE